MVANDETLWAMKVVVVVAGVAEDSFISCDSLVASNTFDASQRRARQPRSGRPTVTATTRQFGVVRTPGSRALFLQDRLAPQTCGSTRSPSRPAGPAARLGQEPGVVGGRYDHHDHCQNARPAAPLRLPLVVSLRGVGEPKARQNYPAATRPPPSSGEYKLSIGFTRWNQSV